MTKLVHCDQTGFILSLLLKTSDNVPQLLHIIHTTKDIISSNTVFSLDAKKAFESVEWDYLWAVMHEFGLGLKFIKMNQLLNYLKTKCLKPLTVY